MAETLTRLQRWFGELRRRKVLRVASRTSSFQFKGRSADVREIGRTLGVGAVLEGSVRRSGDRVRVNAQLVNAADGYHLWSESYDRLLEDVFGIQSDIARRLARALAVRGVWRVDMTEDDVRAAVAASERRLQRRPDDVRALLLGAVQAAIAGDRQRAIAYGERDRALELLDHAVRHGRGNLGWIENDADLDSLRGDPRFESILARLRGTAAGAPA
jgi:hypothetical protein